MAQQTPRKMSEILKEMAEHLLRNPAPRAFVRGDARVALPGQHGLE